MHILIAHDLSPEADLALQRAAQLAAQHNARLTLLHIVDRLPADPSIERHLNEKLARFNLPDAQVRFASGKPSQTIAAQADGIGADLLVLGAHHKQRPELFAGTTLERLARSSSIPLLLAVNQDSAPYRQALVALDFSQCANAALHQAHRLLPDNAELFALNICEVAPSRAAEDQAELEMQCQLFSRMVADEQAQLASPGRVVQYGIRHGERNDCLQATLEERRPQLLALGRHTRSLMSEALLGSLTQEMLRQPPCDVLVTRGG